MLTLDRRRKSYVYSPLFIDEKNDISYTYNDQEGLLSTNQSRAVLRARTVLAVAYMRANISFFEEGGLLYYGETHKISYDAGWMRDEADEFVKIPGSKTADHVGYYVVPANGEAGWSGQAGWAVVFMQEGMTAEHTMWYVYKTLRTSMLYLLNNEDIYGNILSARAPYKNKFADNRKLAPNDTNSDLP